MKISSIRPLIVGEQRNFFFVVVETDCGLRGVGEGGITWREAAMAGFVDALSPSLLGQDPRRTEHLWQVMFRCGFFPAGRAGMAAVSAIDIALWDIKAQSLGVPLYQLLGGLVRDKVVCYPHVRGDDTAALVADAQAKVADGWRFVRFDLPSRGNILEPAVAVRDGVEQFAAVRQAVGPDVEIILDVHTRLDPTDAITLCRQLEPYRPFFVEDPVRSEHPAALEKLCRAVRVPIGMGEQWATKWEFREAIEKEWIDYCRVDLCIVGGITEALKLAGWCETHYIPLAPHNPLGPVSTAACLHLDLATSNFAVQECARVPGTVLPELFPVQVPFDRGWLLPPTQPGLGVEIDLAALDRYPAIIGGDCPRFQREDGSFANW
ncbi:MAG: enolase C-terminal domain-like protein [Pirellulales bacterium]